MLVQMERQIDREIAADNKANGIVFGTQNDSTHESSISTIAEDFDFDSDEEEVEDNGPHVNIWPSTSNSNQ